MRAPLTVPITITLCLLAFTSFPVFVLALTPEPDPLRAQIQADLRADPRTANLSDAEISSMVEALAGEMRAQGQAESYLEERALPQYEEAFADTFSSSSQSPYPSKAVLASIVAVILGLGALLMWRSRGPKPRGVVA